MPYIRLQTNLHVSDGEELLRKLSSAAAAAIGKPESYVQTALEDSRMMTFAGSGDPTAFIECKSIGLGEEQTAGISAALCSFCAGELGIPDGRIYIEFTGAVGRMWGWRGGTF